MKEGIYQLAISVEHLTYTTEKFKIRSGEITVILFCKVAKAGVSKQMIDDFHIWASTTLHYKLVL